MDKKNHNFKNLLNQQFGYLTVVSINNERLSSKATYWNCKCVCGKIRSLQTYQLTSGSVTSCGCKNPRFLLSRNIKSNTRLYHIYSAMIARCYNPKSTPYRYYGAKGITVCDEWKNSFEAFTLWANNHGYADNLSIDRINNSKGYCPDNCRWVPLTEQSKNRSFCVSYTHNGESHNLKDWCNILGFDYTLAKSRRKEAKRKNIEPTFEYVFAPAKFKRVKNYPLSE